MNSKRIFTLLLSLLMVIAIQAQNSIDRMVEQYSSVGGSTFTSAVQRNPKTRQVEKVVKRLEIEGAQSHKFIEAFKREARTHSNSTIKRKDSDLTIVITEENKQSNRIYMLKGDENMGRPAQITIIIRIK